MNKNITPLESNDIGDAFGNNSTFIKAMGQ